MAKRAKTESFVAEFPLKVNQHASNELWKRFKAACNLYNGVLGEAKARARRMRSDRQWKVAKTMPKATKAQRKARNKVYNKLKVKHGFQEFELQKYAERMRDKSWIGHHLGSHDTQTTAKRAFTAVADWVHGQKGCPSRKRLADFHSIEGKSNDAVIRFRENRILWDGLEMPVLLDAKDKDRWQAQALACRTKYVRILKGNGKHPFSVQLIQEGLPPKRDLPRATEGRGCLDMGPKKMGAVLFGKEQTIAALLTLAPEVQHKDTEIARIQRAMDRSLLGTNPNNYKPDGTAKRGCKWIRSPHYRALQGELRKLKAKAAAGVKSSHGKVVNQIRALVKEVNLEDISYVAWQKMYGKSAQQRSPGAFVAKLKQTFAATGGTVTEFKTQTTKLSQYDHTTDDYLKKPLSQRTHHFRDGKTPSVQRDVYSAYLGCFVKEDLLDTCSVRKNWAGAEPLLRQPVSSLPIIHKRKSSPSEGCPVATRQSGSVVRDICMLRSAPLAPLEGKTSNPIGKPSATAILSDYEVTQSQNPRTLGRGSTKLR